MYFVYTFDSTLRHGIGMLQDLQLHKTTYTNKHTQKKECSHTSILQVGFESTIPVFKQWKMVHTLHYTTGMITPCEMYHY